MIAPPPVDAARRQEKTERDEMHEDDQSRVDGERLSVGQDLTQRSNELIVNHAERPE